MENQLCKYCKQPKEKIDCAKYDKGCYDCVFSIHEGITFILFILSLFFSSYKEKLEKHKYKVTCVNKDCIGYLDGCYVNKWRLKLFDDKDK